MKYNYIPSSFYLPVIWIWWLSGHKKLVMAQQVDPRLLLSISDWKALLSPFPHIIPANRYNSIFESNIFKQPALFQAFPDCKRSLIWELIEFPAFALRKMQFKTDFVTDRIRSMGKVMFLHLPVSLFPGGTVLLARQTPLEDRPSPPRRDGQCRGRYASYWNALLLSMVSY